MYRRWSSLAILGAMAACLWTSTAAVRADEVILFTSDAGGGANCVRILSGGANTNYVIDIRSQYTPPGNARPAWDVLDKYTGSISELQGVQRPRSGIRAW